MQTTTAKPSKLKGKSPELVKPGKTKAVIFGRSGVGKTWFSLDFPSVYYIDTEGGANGAQYQAKLQASGGVYMGPEDGSLDFGTVIEQMQALATEAHGYKTLVIDSITKLYQTCIANEAERLGDKDAFGASKKPAIAQMRRLVNWAMKLDMNIWLVAHEGTEWGVDEKTGQRAEIGKSPDVWEKLIYELDLTLKASKRGASRYASVYKSRVEGLKEGETFPLSYSEFSSRFGREGIEAQPKTIELASADQLAAVTRLLDTVKVTPADLEKVFTKAAVDRWEEMTIAQADATIKWLKAKIA